MSENSNPLLSSFSNSVADSSLPMSRGNSSREETGHKDASLCLQDIFGCNTALLEFPGIYVDFRRISWILYSPIPLLLCTPTLRLQHILHILCIINWYCSTGVTQVRPCSSFCNMSLDISYKQLFYFKTYCLKTKC